MKFIDSSFEIIKQERGWDGMYKHIEKIARVSYKSEDRITDGSAKIMVNNLIKSKHFACLEHGTIYMTIPSSDESVKRYKHNMYSRVVTINDFSYITTNFRVLLENNYEDDMRFIDAEPSSFHIKRYSVKFVWPIGIVRDALRHRKNSFINESTRWINYTKTKFGGLTIVIPGWIYDIRDEESSFLQDVDLERAHYLENLTGEELVNELYKTNNLVKEWYDSLANSEKSYFVLTTEINGKKLKPEYARGVLPLDTKSELVITGFEDDWVHFFNIRSDIGQTGLAHPDMRYTVNGLLRQFIDNNYINYEDLYKTQDKNVST